MIKNKTIILDANYILRYLLKDQKVFYKQISVVFESLRLGETKGIILESVLTECVYVLVKFYKVPRKKMTETLINLLNYKGFQNKDKPVMITALNLFQQTKVDFVDCLVAAKGFYEDYEVLSFDKDIKKLSKLMGHRD